MPDRINLNSDQPKLSSDDVVALRSLFRRLHGEPMQAVATSQILLAAWERAVKSGDSKTAVEAAHLLGDQVRSIGTALQAIEREGLELLSAPDTARARDHDKSTGER
jgi:hypothetical protein